ncbi:hypothetical protein GCM10022267_76770 [Lentzea roselyniae]|uniref:Uncharacterized protein n=1 Tax=Lentzea roselyniae TaxID=531940 RepID=A0ABP7C693_9PSEU
MAWAKYVDQSGGRVGRRGGHPITRIRVGSINCGCWFWKSKDRGELPLGNTKSTRQTRLSERFRR